MGVVARPAVFDLLETSDDLRARLRANTALFRSKMTEAGFERLPESSRALHLAGVLCIALATILLMTPAARHRLVEGGEDTEAFHQFASRVLLAAMVPLAPALIKT